MQIEKALINDRLRVSKVSWKLWIPQFIICSNLPVKYAPFLKRSLRVPTIFFVYKQSFTAQ